MICNIQSYVSRFLYQYLIYGLTHYYFYSMSLAITKYWKNIALDSIAIYSNTLDTLIYMIRIHLAQRQKLPHPADKTE